MRLPAPPNIGGRFVSLDFGDAGDVNLPALTSAASGGLTGGRSPRLVSSFPALKQRKRVTVVPPDTNGAVGPRHLVVALNSHVVVQDRAGRALKTVSLETFWRKTGAIRIFDPRILYDPYGRRWILSAATGIVASSPTTLIPSAVLIAVSRTRNPLGRWDLYRVDVESTSVLSADMPLIGFNSRWIVVQTQLAGSETLVGSQLLLAFEKADLYRGGAGNFSRFAFEGDFAAIAPVVTFDASLATMYLLQLSTRPFSDPPELRIYTMTGSVGAENIAPRRIVPVPDFISATTENLAPQRDSPVGIDVGEASHLSVVYRNGALWAVHSMICCEPEHRSIIRWWRLESLTGTVLDGGLIDDPTGNYFYAYPSIAVNRFDDVLIGYSRFSASEYAGGAYSFRAGIDAPGILRGERVVKGGEGPYVREDASGRNRWGDYSATVVDPRNDRDLWTIQEYAESENRWGTWWVRIVPRRF
jgi:hypothetical protein